jgi:predicted ester cyclase
MITQLRTMLPDVHATIEDIFAEGNKVAVRWTFRGTYQGEARPGAPTPGEPCMAVAIAMYRFVEGKIADDWGVTAFWQTGKVWENTSGQE